jgi:hypothetical protein
MVFNINVENPVEKVEAIVISDSSATSSALCTEVSAE